MRTRPDGVGAGEDFSSCTSCIIYDFSIPWVKVGCWVRKYSLLLIYCFSEKEIAAWVRVKHVSYHACTCWTADLLHYIYQVISAHIDDISRVVDQFLKLIATCKVDRPEASSPTHIQCERSRHALLCSGHGQAFVGFQY
jgi:hypothetical protein